MLPNVFNNMKVFFVVIILLVACKSNEKIQSLKDIACEKYYNGNYNGAIKTINKLMFSIPNKSLNNKRSFIYFSFYNNTICLDSKTVRAAKRAVKKLEHFNDTSFYALGLALMHYNFYANYDKVIFYSDLIHKKPVQSGYELVKKQAYFLQTLNEVLKVNSDSFSYNASHILVDSITPDRLTVYNCRQLIHVLYNSRFNDGYIQLWELLYNSVKVQRSLVIDDEYHNAFNLYLYTELYALSEDYTIEERLGEKVIEFRKDLGEILKSNPNLNQLNSDEKASVYSAWGYANISNGLMDKLYQECAEGNTESCNRYSTLEAESDSLFDLFKKYKRN